MASRIVSHSVLLRDVRRLRRAGKTIVTTNGSFDLLHIGHVRFLQRASRLADVLVVLLNSDASIRRLKGPTRPILPQRIRAEMLAALRGVAYVTVFDSDTPLALLRQIRPDIHAKGGSWKHGLIAAEKKLVASWGGTMKLFPMAGEYSTTNLIERIRRQFAGRVPPRGEERRSLRGS